VSSLATNFTVWSINKSSSLSYSELGRGTRGNAVFIVEKLPEHTGTAFPLLKCLGTNYGRICNHFPAKNVLDFRILHI